METIDGILYGLAMYFKKYMIIIVLSLLSWLYPIKETLWIVGFLVMSDFVTGVIKAHKLRIVSSRKMINKCYTSAGYFVCIIVARNLELYLNDTVPLVKPIAVMIATSELQSLRENIKIITGHDLLLMAANFIKVSKKG